VGNRAGLYILEKRKIPYPYQGSKPHFISQYQIHFTYTVTELNHIRYMYQKHTLFLTDIRMLQISVINLTNTNIYLRYLRFFQRA
jgi:hypothetical protein